MDLEKLVTRSLDLVNVVAKQDRDPFVALLVELIEEKRPEGPEQVEALVREAVECFEMERDDLAERVLEMLPVSDITTGFLQEKPIMEGDRCVVALEETGWHKGTVLRIFGEKDKRRFVCVLDDYGGEHSVSRSELAMEWETSDLGVRGKDDEDGVCPMCERTSLLTAHHLRPRQMHARLIKKFTREELNRCLHVCRPCHSAIHRAKSNAELAASFFTLDSILAIDQIQVWLKFARTARVRAASQIK